jgi:hypothetical protein
MDEVGLTIPLIHLVVYLASFAGLWLWINWKFNEFENMEIDLTEFEQILHHIGLKLQAIENIKEYIPEFTINQNPLVQLFESYMGYKNSEQDLRADPARGNDGRWLVDGETEEKE